MDADNRHHLDASVGWMGLGNLGEAVQELNRMAPEWALHPDVLEVKWELHGRQKRWQEALRTAELLVDSYPDRCSGWLHRSYCLHELQRTLEAWNKLIPAFDKFPKEATIPYNLACYACCLGNLDVAKVWLEKAVLIRGRRAIKAIAVNDKDLLELHATLHEW